MSQISTIFWFDLRQRLRRLGFWVYYAMYLTGGCLLFMAGAGAFPSVQLGLGTGGKVLTNSPFSLHQMAMLYTVFSLQLTAASMGQAVHQDFQHDTAQLFFTTPMKRSSYLIGRYLAALAHLTLLFSSFGLGFLLGSVMPQNEPTLVGPNRLAAYVMPYLVGVIPNQIICGSLFFALAARTRQMRWVYTVSVVLLAAYLISGAIDIKVEYKWLASLVDPFGLFATQFLTEYWSIAQKNHNLIGYDGGLLWNRLLWMAIAVGGTIALTARLRLGHAEAGGTRGPQPEAGGAPSSSTLPVPTITPVSGGALVGRLGLFLYRDTVKNIYFVVMMLAALGFFLSAVQSMGSIFGTSTYPVTYQVVGLAGGTFQLFEFIVIAYFSGELVWRERDAKIDQIVDALPVPDWLWTAARLLALAIVMLTMATLTTLCGLMVQVWKGYYHFELRIYAVELFGFGLWNNLLVCAWALLWHSIAKQKTVGHTLVIGYWIGLILLGRFGFEHHLYRYATWPDGPYSDMNHWGATLVPQLWLGLYWTCWAGVLLVLAILFGLRGREQGWAHRLKLARQRLSGATLVLLALYLVGAGAVGAFIFYNTDVLNRYLTSNEQRTVQADMERRYKPLEKLPQPKVTSFDIDYDLKPRERWLRARVVYELKNETAGPIDRVVVVLDPNGKLESLAVGEVAAPTESDRTHGMYQVVLPTPLAAGATTQLRATVLWSTPGFPNSDFENRLAYNGTFVDLSMLPQIGYSDQGELSSDDARRKHGLKPKERMPSLDDASERQRNYVTPHSDWVKIHSTIATDEDQVAVAPGSKVREWVEGGRRHYEYQTDAPVLGFFSMLSARYEVRRDKWHDIDIEVYYHPTHTYNVETMVTGVKDTLEYLTATIGPYPHKQVRIVEFPRYQTFAQSFPSTIPFSEAIGFIARVDPNDEKDVDYPYYVTSHEVAHQWWADQLVGANTQGTTLLSESLSQYTALMVMKKKFGAAMMKHYLQYELNGYLQGRSFEQKKELPIVRNENQQYIHYQKGSLVTYALADYVGEDVFNRGLKAFFVKYKWAPPPYPTSRELMAELRAVLPPEQHVLLEDWFENITLYSLRAESAEGKKRDDGKYEVTVSVTAEATRADELGDEKPWPVKIPVDIGVLGEKGRALVIEKHTLEGGKGTFTLVVEEKPARAGIDPLNKLIDRVPDDNTQPVKLK